MAGADTPPSEEARARLRALPSVSSLLEGGSLSALEAEHGRGLLTRAVRKAVDDARAAILAGQDATADAAAVGRALRALRSSSLVEVVNAAGVIVHTNLGRAPLAPEAVESVVQVASGYSTLEYDLDAGERGSRHGHAVSLLCELTGAEDACVVNNNAAAVMLTLSALAEGREVIVSRGELVEIGGGFRVPDVMVRSGADLVEVGTTNRTRASDYARAINERTAVLLKVHRSNFAMVGFTEDPPLPALAALAREHDVPFIVDAGSGSLRHVPFDEDEVPVGAALSQGADLVTFSGDKLLGGPQAGIIVGRADLVERCRRYPLMRALRPDKMCIAALVTTLRLWRDHPERVPVARMLDTDPETLDRRAAALAFALKDRGEVVPTRARVGGGASPLVELDSRAVALRTDDADGVAARLRAGTPPIVARIDRDRVLLDLIAIDPADDERVLLAVRAALRADD
jgi:L-seryl-tRNA(Ser) seleniumtransferase